MALDIDFEEEAMRDDLDSQYTKCFSRGWLDTQPISNCFHL